MSSSRKSLKNQRNRAFQIQNGICLYCKYPMWLNKQSKFASQHNISIKKARLFRCTGEHLVPHSDGGAVAQENIAAACQFCNQTRHRSKTILSPEAFSDYVQRRLRKGAWNANLMA